MEEEIVRVKIPKGKEMFGRVIENLGSSRLRVGCSDGKTRIARIPGRLRKRLWVDNGDYVIVEPDEIQGDQKGEVHWKYAKNQIDWLRKQGYLKGLE